MPAPLILSAAAAAVPALTRWIAGDDSKAARIAQAAGDVVQELTGTADLDAGLSAVRADPALYAQFRARLLEHVEAMAAIELEQLRTVNATMQKEATSSDPYVRRWRPTFGYIVSATWATQFAAIAYAMVATPQYAAELVQAIVALTPAWGIALAVLGINVRQRSRDKEVAAGFKPVPGLLDKIIGGVKTGGGNT